MQTETMIIAVKAGGRTHAHIHTEAMLLRATVILRVNVTIAALVM